MSWIFLKYMDKINISIVSSGNSLFTDIVGNMHAKPTTYLQMIILLTPTNEWVYKSIMKKWLNYDKGDLCTIHFNLKLIFFLV